MMKKVTYVGLFAFISLLALTPLSLFSEEGCWSTLKFELSTAVSLEKSLLDSSYFHRYSPPFLSGAYTSNAQQTVNLNGQTGWGINAAFAYLPFKDLGFQFQVEYAKPKTSGKNSPYLVHLDYALSQDAVPPYPYTFERTFGWPDTVGHLSELCFSLNALFRLPLSKKIALSFSGGLTYFLIDGEGTGLSYAKYWKEEAYFMGETYQFKFKFGTLNKLGLNAGAELNSVLFSTICYVMDVRFFGCPTSTLSMDIINEGLIPDPFDQVKATMSLHDIRINPSFYRINFGLKYLF
jgi:hypothetical protein